VSGTGVSEHENSGNGNGASIWPRLTRRERQIARRLADGWSYTQIASDLGVSYHTVNTHVKAIYRKANVESRGRLAVLIMRSPGDESP
jgi:DNA-binding CsgD family transcriptional regulator